MFIGNGANVIYIDQEHESRRRRALARQQGNNGFVKRLLAAVEAR